MSSPNAPASSDALASSNAPLDELPMALTQRLPYLEAAAQKLSQPESKALLAQQLGKEYEQAGRPRDAVSQWLAASNEVAGAEESTHQLLRLIEQHRSFGNLAPLIAHACANAKSPRQRRDAYIASAWMELNHNRNTEAARQAAIAALSADPGSALASVTLEVVARRLGDDTLLAQALNARIEATQDPTLRACVLLQYTRLVARQGNFRDALARLEPVCDRDAGWLYAQCPLQLAYFHIGLQGRPSVQSDARAQLLSTLQALETGMPANVSEATQGTELLALLLRATVSSRQPSRPAVTTDLVQRVEQLTAPDGANRAFLDTIAFEVAIATQDLAAAESAHCRAEHLGTQGPLPAARWVALAQLRLAAGREGAATQALASAISADPTSRIAHARLLHCLRRRDEGQHYAEALESWANVEDEQSPQSWVLAADAWARRAANAPRAAEALRRAVDAGLAETTAARLSLAYARWLRNSDWVEQSSLRLAKLLHLTSGERASMEVAALLRRVDSTPDVSIVEGLAPLKSLPEANFLTNLWAAFAPGQPARPRTAALEYLARNHGPEPLGASFRLVAALRMIRPSTLDTVPAMDPTSEARARTLAINHLRATVSTLPFHAPCAGSLGCLLESDPADAPTHLRTLRAVAARSTDDQLAQILWLEAGAREFRRGNSSKAIGDFRNAQQKGSQAAPLLLHWLSTRLPADEAMALDLPRQEDELVSVLKKLSQAGTQSREWPKLANALLTNPSREHDEALLCAGDVLLMMSSWRAPASSSEAGFGAAAAERLLARGTVPGQLATCLAYVSGKFAPGATRTQWCADARRWAKREQSTASFLAWCVESLSSGQSRERSEALSALRQAEGSAAPPELEALWAWQQYTEGQLPAPSAAHQGAVDSLTSLEFSPPGGASGRRTGALQTAIGSLGTEDDAIAALLSGYHLSEAGDLDGAIAAFEIYATAFPNDALGWEGMLNSASQLSRTQLDRAVLGLQDTEASGTHIAELLENAADLYVKRYEDGERARATLVYACGIDPSRTATVNKLLKLLQPREHDATRLRILTQALELATDPPTRRDLFWQHALTLRSLDRQQEALAATERFVAEHPDHAAGHALLGELHILRGEFEAAVDHLTSVVLLPDAPPEQRLTSGLVAVDLLENQLESTSKALKILLQLHRSGLADLAVRERTARAALKLEAWSDALVVLQQLMVERATPEERAEAARMALAIHRDRLATPHAAASAVQALLAINPTDPEALDLVIEGDFDAELVSKLLKNASDSLVLQLQQAAPTQDTLEVVVAVAKKLGAMALLQKALGTSIALGHSKPGYEAQLEIIEQSSGRCPPKRVGPEGLSQLLADFAPHPLERALQLVDPHLAEEFYPTVEDLKGAEQPAAALELSPLLSEVSAWAAALGFDDYKLYSSSAAAASIVVTRSGDKLAIVIGYKVTSPLAPVHRQQLTRGLIAAATGYELLVHQQPEQATTIARELTRLASLPSREENAVVARQVRRSIPRKVRRALVQWGKEVGPVDPAQWVERGQHLLDQVAIVATGDMSWAIATGAPARRQTAPGATDIIDRIGSLTTFLFSERFDGIRNTWKLGPDA